jgi:hypothetical protein
MKNKTLKILSLCLVLAVALSCVLSVSAAKYVTNVISKSSDYAAFVQPGDTNMDKKVDASDYSELREMLLNNASSRYSDVNGDEGTDICDLVLQSEQPDAFVDGAKITLKGKSVYGADIKAALTAGAKYKLTFKKTGDVTVKISGIKDYNGNVIATSASDYIFKTPKTISDVSLEIVGDGTIENLKLVRVDMDNDVSITGVPNS